MFVELRDLFIRLFRLLELDVRVFKVVIHIFFDIIFRLVASDDAVYAEDHRDSHKQRRENEDRALSVAEYVVKRHDMQLSAVCGVSAFCLLRSKILEFQRFHG